MKQFRTIEQSKSSFSPDYLRFITVKTDSLKGRGDFIAYIPNLEGIADSAAQDLPVIILLHGVYGSAWSWPFNTGIHLKAQDLIAQKKIQPCIIAMPSDGLWGDGSGYIAHNGYDFEQWIVDDLPQILTQCISRVTHQSPYFISGNSMGGFGALRLGITYPSIFKAVSAHSAITDIKQMELFVEESIRNYQNVPDEMLNIYKLAVSNRDHLPRLRFDCGKDDLLITYNRELHKQLTESNINHTYEESIGEHNWNYWERQITDTLLFFNSIYG